MDIIPNQPSERARQLRVPSVSTLLLLGGMLLVVAAVCTWWMARAGIHRVQAVGGEVYVDPSRASHLVNRLVEFDPVLLAVDHDVRFVFFTGTHIDDASIPVLQQFPSLDALQLRGTSITDHSMGDIGLFSKITTLSVSDSPRVTDVGISALAKLPHLRQVGFENCGMTGEGLSKLTELEVIDLEDSPLLGSRLFHELSQLPKLRILSLWGSHVTDASFQDTLPMPSLEEMHLSSTDITDEALNVIASQCPNLRILSIVEMSRITDDGVRQLTQLKSLEHLVIVDSHISAEAARSLQDAMPHCRIEHESFSK